MKINSYKSLLLKAIISIMLCFFYTTGLTQNVEIKKEGNNYQLDPLFPEFVYGEKNIEMQKYAKMHPPVPFEEKFSNYELFEIKLKEWIKINPYYPQFIPYHLFKGGLKIEDSYRFYERAKIVWENAH